MNYIVYTDGAYSSVRNQMGIGIVFLKEGKLILEYSKMFKKGTNNVAEILAIIIAFSMIKQPIESLTIISDSMYCIGCATKGWKRNKNIKLWKEFDKQYARVSELCSNIVFQYVKGHQSELDTTEAYWNNYVDKLAVFASKLI